MAETIETRPFPPFLPKKATVMMMGTFPPEQSKRAMDSIIQISKMICACFGLVFFDEKDHFRNGEEKRWILRRLKAFLSEAGIASCPTVLKAILEKGNASDAFLKVVEPVPLDDVLEQNPDCKHIGTTGGKATEILLSLYQKRLNYLNRVETIPFVLNGRKLTLTRLPSTSRLSVEPTEKAEAYKNFFKACGLKTK